MKTASWVLLTVVGVLMLLGSLASANIAYRGGGKDQVGALALREAVTSPEALVALQARRGTAAAFAGGFATLFLMVVLGPYRRGDKGSWWALLVSLLVLNLMTAARQPLLGVTAGIGAPAIALGIAFVALLLDVGRLRARR